ncbi:TetR family transcriptional regulator [Aliidongia dinghuensis]|uniref:TetR family transcriptional regulator n=1 Tax=Aliidongia dinghuensis TaxID=1867774 RepID=A0A8J3E4U1_9PROT|nr:TetR/AcrR family transcriptional regulator [Aliidongia dinghuensis]GGF30090.1 TetR family transcriptional regulator [Aliidongia dinghuensis]
MKKSRAETAETRRRIVAAAAEEFRKNGIHETSLCELMAAAGMTEGGFYRHFNSKDQLVAEACAAGLKSTAEAIKAAAEDGDGKTGLEAIVETYLSPEHQRDRWQGCPFVSLGSEMARADEATRAAATEGFKRLVDVVATQCPENDPAIAKERAEFILCSLVGVMTMARLVTDPDLAIAIVENTRKYLAKA